MSFIFVQDFLYKSTNRSLSKEIENGQWSNDTSALSDITWMIYPFCNSLKNDSPWRRNDLFCLVSAWICFHDKHPFTSLGPYSTMSEIVSHKTVPIWISARSISICLVVIIEVISNTFNTFSFFCFLILYKNLSNDHHLLLKMYMCACYIAPKQIPYH